MARIDDGKHICPIMTRDITEPIACTDNCAVLMKTEVTHKNPKENNTFTKETWTYCGMMPTGEN
jgi:hypothetical protein